MSPTPVKAENRILPVTFRNVALRRYVTIPRRVETPALPPFGYPDVLYSNKRYKFDISYEFQQLARNEAAQRSKWNFAKTTTRRFDTFPRYRFFHCTSTLLTLPVSRLHFTQPMCLINSANPDRRKKKDWKRRQKEKPTNHALYCFINLTFVVSDTILITRASINNA